MANRIAVLHEAWISHGSVGADEIAVLAVMALHASKDGACFPSQGLLARLLGRSRPWVCKVIAKLTEIGLIEKTDRSRTDGGRRTCLYRLIGPVNDSEVSGSPTTTIVQPVAGHPGDMVSHDENSPCSSGDVVTPDQEIKQDSHPASTPEIEVISVVPKTVPGDREVRVAITPPKDWTPSDDDLLFGMDRFPNADLNAATERFVGRCRAKGYRYFDLNAAWRVWLVEDQAAAKLGPATRYGQSGKQRESAAQVRYDAWASVAQHARTEAHHAA